MTKRLPAFFALTHYGIYTPLHTNRYGGTLSYAHTDFTIANLRRWVAIVRGSGMGTVYGRPMHYWAPLQFGYDDNRPNPVLTANRTQLEYYVQQLDHRVGRAEPRPGQVSQPHKLQ